MYESRPSGPLSGSERSTVWILWLPPLAITIRKYRSAAIDGLVNFYVPGYVQTGVSKFSSSIRGRFDREIGTWWTRG